jgi:transposase-like protein
MAFLFKKEEEDAVLTYQARDVAEGIARGESAAAVCARLSVDPDQLREWRRNKHFRAHVRRSRRGPVRPHIF